MSKECPKCGLKNNDSNRECVHCYSSLEGVVGKKRKPDKAIKKEGDIPKRCPYCDAKMRPNNATCPACFRDVMEVQRTGTPKKEPLFGELSSKGKLGIAFTVIMIFLISINVIISDPEDKKNNSSSISTVLNVAVSYTGTQFIIQNNDSFDYKNVTLEVNKDYTYKASMLEAGGKYTIGALNFAKKDGEKFNPFTHKAMNFGITCNTSTGKTGVYSGTWE